MNPRGVLVGLGKVAVEWLCRFLWWNTYSLYACSSWSYVWISLDRFVAIWIPNWYRIRGKKDKVKLPLLVFTLLVYLLMSPNVFFRELSPETDENSVFNSVYTCTWKSTMSWFNQFFVEFCGDVPVLLVLLLNVASSADILARLFGKVSTKKDQAVASNQSKTSGNCISKAKIKSDSKISIILVLIAVFFLVFVGGGNVLWHYQNYVSTSQQAQRLRKLLLLLNNSCYAMNGSINGFILLIFPSMRQAFKQRMKKLFRL